MGRLHLYCDWVRHRLFGWNKSWNYNCPTGFLYIYLVGLVAARGPMALAVGGLRKKSEPAGMVLGVVIETMIFFSIDFILFGLGFALFDLGTFVDLVFVPITVAVFAIRRIFDTKYLS